MSTHPSSEPLVGRYSAGMPQLCGSGLSENWLLKECGHRHWLAIARSQGLARPRFHDAQGQRVYAAFTLLRIRQARLERVEEHDDFDIATQCQPAGRTQHYSRHEVLLRGRCIAEVEMLSVFVRRTQAGNNRSIVRAVMAGSDAAAPFALAAAAEAFVQRGRALRAASPRQASEAATHAIAFTPCPYNDFNGADLLYFSSFQSMVDRAEWDWMHNPHPAHLRERELVFYGNLDIGDAIRCELRAGPAAAGQFTHASVFLRGCDGMRLAEVFTRKQLARTAQALAA
ncbi:MAG: hypothetical protein RR311_00190 [Comamonas sp.]